ncbi:MAG: hypothetical protein ACPGYX_05125, partial [Oceanobacter sp.]
QASELSEQLQQLRISALSVMTDFSLFVQMNGDRKYGRLIHSDADIFKSHLRTFKQISNQLNSDHGQRVASAWNAFNSHVDDCLDQQYRQDMVDERNLLKARDLNQELTALIDEMYQSEIQSTQPGSKLESLREMAVMVERLTFSRAWNMALRSAERDIYPNGQGYTPELTGEEFDTIISAFETRLAQLVKRNNPMQQEVLQGIQAEWKLLKRSLDPDASVPLPMLSVSLTDRIQQGFTKLEDF